MTITPTQVPYEDQKRIRDSTHYYTHVLLRNTSITATGTIDDVDVGSMTFISMQAWISGFTGGTTPTITFSIQDLNVATYQAQSTGQATTTAQETMGSP